MLGKVYKRKSINGLLMHAKRKQYGMCQINVLYRPCVFHTYIVWCKLTHLHERLLFPWHNIVKMTGY